MPGGVIDEGETPDEACARELAEETGYTGRRGPAEIMGKVSANPAMQNNWCYFGLVRGAERTSGQSLDEREEVGVRAVPLDDIPGMIRAGTIHHSLIIAAFHFLSLRGGGI